MTTRTLASALLTAILLTSLPSLAVASHFRGAAMVPSVSAGGLLTVNATSFWRPSGVSDIDEGGPIRVNGGSLVNAATTQVGPQANNTSDTRFTQVTSTHTLQLPGSGLYALEATSCCRVGGIVNAAEDSWTMNSAIFWDGSTASTPILFNFSAVQSEVVRGATYSGNLGAVAGPGLTLSYDQNLNQNISSQPPGFTINPSTGALSIPAGSTATYLDNPSLNVGADYAFSGNIKASNGSFVEFDWLFDAVNTSTANRAPSVTDAILNILLGQTASHTFVGSDPDGNPLTWSFVNFLGSPVLPASFNPATQLFTWDSTGSPLGAYVGLVQASDGTLTDVGQLTINVLSPNNTVPEPATLLLLGTGILATVRSRRRGR